MKFLTIIRHAKANSDSLSGQDFDRELSERGLLDAPRMGAYLLKNYQFAPDRMVSSPAARAIATACCIAEAIRFPVDKIQQESSIYEAQRPKILAVVRATSDEFRHLCLVGHNPGLEQLAAYIASPLGMFGLVTAGVVRLQINVDRWSEVGGQTGQLLSYDYPAALWGNEHR